MKTYKVAEMPRVVRCIIVYGESGSGKTRFCATAQHYEPWSPSLLAVIGTEQAASVRDTPDLHVVELNTLGDIDWLCEYFMEGQPTGARVHEREDWPTFKSLCFDGLTEAHALVMRKKMGTPEKGRSLLTGSLATLPPSAVMRDWGTGFNWVLNLLRIFGGPDFPVPVIMTALERYDEDDVSGSTMVAPMLAGQLAGLTPSKGTVTMRLVRGRTYGVTMSDWRTLVEIYEKEGGDIGKLDNVGLLYSDGKYKAVNRLGPQRWLFNPTVDRLVNIGVP